MRFRDTAYWTKSRPKLVSNYGIRNWDHEHRFSGSPLCFENLRGFIQERLWHVAVKSLQSGHGPQRKTLVSWVWISHWALRDILDQRLGCHYNSSICHFYGTSSSRESANCDKHWHSLPWNDLQFSVRTNRSVAVGLQIAIADVTRFSCNFLQPVALALRLTSILHIQDAIYGLQTIQHVHT